MMEIWPCGSPLMIARVKFNVVKSMAIFDAFANAKAYCPARPPCRIDNLRTRTGFGLWPSRSGGPDGTGNGPGRAGSLGRNRALPHGQDRARRTHAHAGADPQNRRSAEQECRGSDRRDGGKPALGTENLVSEKERRRCPSLVYLLVQTRDKSIQGYGSRGARAAFRS